MMNLTNERKEMRRSEILDSREERKERATLLNEKLLTYQRSEEGLGGRQQIERFRKEQAYSPQDSFISKSGTIESTIKNLEINSNMISPIPSPTASKCSDHLHSMLQSFNVRNTMLVICKLKS